MFRFGMLAVFLSVLLPPTLNAQSISVGDTVIVEGAAVREKPSVLSDKRFSLDSGEKVVVQKVADDHYFIAAGFKEGWISRRAVMSGEELKEFRRDQARKRRRREERRQYLDTLQQKGYTILLWGQSLSVNSADGVSVKLQCQNISESKVVKYAVIEWRLFNTVGDPTSGQNGTPASTTTRFVGPLEPGETGTVEFENVWYSSVGRCAEIRRIKVEHVDGSTFTYVNDLEDIVRYAKGVRLNGDCSYEAQQLREAAGNL